MYLSLANKPSIFSVRFALVTVGLLLLLLPWAPVVYAATINVDGDCSLANAIRSANGVAQTGDMDNCETGDAGADTINFTGDVSLTEALPEITSTVTLEGNNRTLRRASSAGDLRLLLVAATGNLTINNLTLRNGRLSGNISGGAVRVGAGGALTTNNSIYRDNVAPWGGAMSGSGATISVTNSEFVSNSASGANAAGGAIYVSGSSTVTVTGSRFRSNSANQGGAIDAQGSSELTVEGSEFVRNVAESATGGAISTNITNSLIIRTSAFISNMSGGDGGAIAQRGTSTIGGSAFVGNQAGASGGALSTINDTVVENSVFYGNRLNTPANPGAALRSLGATVTLRHVTVLNSGTGANGLAGVQGATLNMVNSVIAGSAGTDCFASSDTSIGTNINNWIEDGSCSSTFSGDPMLSTPRGSPAYIPPYIGSGLVDAVPDDANCLATDQRGVSRPVGPACDIGAYEGSIPRPAPEEAGKVRRAPTPQRSTCETSLSAAVSVSGIVDGSQCQEVDAAGIGNQAVIEAGYIAAVDVWGYIGVGVTVCFEGSGRVVLLDAATSPRMLLGVGSQLLNGQTCAWIDRTGTVVLVPHDSRLSPPLIAGAREADDGSRALSGCMVTTTEWLNLRLEPADRVIGVTPPGVTLTALKRTDGWFEVDYIGTVGWISADYVTAVGSCD